MAGIIDTKLLGKPPRFEGDINTWKMWRFQTFAYLGALDGSLIDHLKAVESQTGIIDWDTLSEEHQARARVVFYVLSQLLAKAPL